MSVFFIFVVLILFFPQLGVGTDDCMPTSCRKNGPRIQFPFRHKYRQPLNCGFPGFDLYCDSKNNETVLELPFSVKVIVKKIDYISQKVHSYDPDECSLQKLLHLNLSASQFQFLENYHLADYILFNCSSVRNPYSYLDSDLRHVFTCLSNSSYEVYAMNSRTNIGSEFLIDCTKLHEISSVPFSILYREDLHLQWSEPACGHCEAQGKLCRFKNYTTGDQLECINKTITNQGEPKRAFIVGATLGCILLVVTVACLYLLYKSISADKEYRAKIESFLEHYRALKPTRFSYADIRKITNEFHEKLGEGGYGTVYKGNLSNEIYVAVKVLNHSEGNGEEFINEVDTIGRIHHVNVVRLVGYCADGSKRALVYEFLPNDSLEKFIFQTGPKRKSFSHEKLLDIALGIAKGIEYLHEGCDQQILHFDIKPHNILLDKNFKPKICDFGLAKLCSKEQSAVSMTAARGTMGYIAPEVMSRTYGRVSYKSDVYSFGMMLLEMVGGRKNLDHSVNTSQVYFPQWIYNHLNQEGEISVVQNQGSGESEIARKLTLVGLWCIQWYPADRPSMKAVVQMLEGDGNSLNLAPNPFPDAIGINSIAGIPGTRYQTALDLIPESGE